jgi:predicted permease
VGRLRPGVSIPQAEADLDPLLAQNEAHPMVPEVELREVYAHSVLTPAARGLSEARDKFGRPAQILMGIAVLVLLIACGNVANLLLSQSIARRREFMIRVALGAGRWRVARQVLTEGALLAAAGTAAGLLAGRWASALLAASLSTRGFPISLSTRLDIGLLLFSAVTLTATILLCGLAPALITSRTDFADDLKVQGSLTHRSLGEARIGGTLVAAQVALAMVLLAGAGLLLHSLFNLETMNTGFDRDRVLLVKMSGYSNSRTRAQMTSFYDQLLSRVKELPGVRSASYSNLSPIGGREIGINVAVDGYTFRPGEEANELFAGVSPGYFATMGIPLLEGREFTDADVQTPTLVAIINRTMAQRFFGDASPLGKHFHFAEGGKRPPLEIIGVVADSKYNDLRESAMDFFYIPGTRGDLEIRTTMAAAAVAGPLREIVRSLDTSVSIAQIRTLREQVDESLHSDRLIAALSSVFSGLALLLTAVGLYGVLAAGVERRTGEIGIRMALGARPPDIFRLVALHGMWLTVCGLLVGFVAALGAGRLLGAMLFGVTKTDPLTFVGVSVVLLATALLACYVPARRAIRVDPMVALRHE